MTFVVSSIQPAPKYNEKFISIVNGWGDASMVTVINSSHQCSWSVVGIDERRGRNAIGKHRRRGTNDGESTGS